MNDERTIEALRRVELFSSLTADELLQLTRSMAIKRFRKNETILFEEDSNEFMYVIVEGEVKAVRSTEDGKEMILAIHRCGEFFGEVSLIDGKTAPARVSAARDSVIALISRKEFQSLLEHPKVLANMLRIFCSRLRESWSKIQMLNFNNASQRIKMLLILLSDKYGTRSEEGITLNIRLTHQDIAEMSGMSRETVTRVIDRLQKSGEISVLKNKCILLTYDFCKELDITPAGGPG